LMARILVDEIVSVSIQRDNARLLAERAVTEIHPNYCEPDDRCAGCDAMDVIAAWKEPS